MYQHRKDRLIALIDAEYGGERVRFCDKTGMSESRLAQLLSKTYRNGEAFTEKTARKLEVLTGLPMMYFDQGMAAIEQPATDNIFELVPGARRVNGVDGDDDGLTQIMKVQIKVQAGMTGFQVEPEHHDGKTTGVPTDWIRDQRFNKADLIAITVRGESMEPALYEGDVIIFNAADKTLVDGSVYVVNYEGEVVVKRMMRDAGMWWLASDNSDQRKYHRKLCKGGECIVIGKVVRKESIHI